MLRKMTAVAAMSLMVVGLTACDGKKKGSATKTTKTTKTTTKNDKGKANPPKTKGDEFVAGHKTGGVFTMAVSADPETFDPATMSGAVEGRIAFNIFEGLLMPAKTTEGIKDPKQLVVPGMAESYPEISADGKTYTFKIRKNAKWSNGKAVIAKDFVNSWKRVLTPGFEADYAQMLWVIEGAQAYNTSKAKDKDLEALWAKVGIIAKDDHTLVVKLNNPTPYFPEYVAFYTYFPTPVDVVKEKGKAWTKPENIVSNGAYKLVSYKPQQEIVLEKNPNYWDAANVKIEKVRMRIISDRNAMVNAYKTGELHWSGAAMPVAQITQLLTHPDYKAEPMLGTYYFRVNVSKKDSPLNDPKVRTALSMAIDRDSIVEQTLNGLYTTANAVVPENMPGFKSTTKIKYNAKKAKKMLAEAGFSKDKPFPAIELLYNTDENHKLVAEAVQSMWKRNLGIDVKLVNKEWKTYLQDIDTLKYQVARAGWIGDYNDPMTFLDMWVTGNGNNDTGWSNAEYDKLIKQAQSEADTAKRTKLLQDAEALLIAQGPVIPIYFYTNNTMISRFVEGFAPHNRDVHLLKYMSLKK